MSESSCTNAGGDGIPAWMKAVDEENFYTAPPESESQRETRETGRSDSSVELSTTRRPSRASDVEATGTLRKKLSVAAGDPTELPEPDPDIQPTNVGQVRSELNRWLEKAVSILNTRYEREISKTLVLEFVIRRELVDLHVHGEDSPVVEWLDSILSRA